MYDNSVVGGREYVGKLVSDFQSTSTWIPLPSLPCQSILKRVKELGLSIFIAWSYMSFREWADSWGLFCAYLCLNLPYIDQDFWPLPAAVLLACLSLSIFVYVHALAVNWRVNAGLCLGVIHRKSSQACSKHQTLLRLNRSSLIINLSCPHCMPHVILCRIFTG